MNLLILKLCLAITVTFTVPQDKACAAAKLIVPFAVEVKEDPVLVAAITYGESGFDPLSVDLRTGACGPMSALYDKDRARQRRRCRAVLVSPTAGYKAGLKKLHQARAFCRSHGDRSDLCALAGFASGPKGVRGKWYRRPRLILYRAKLLRRVLEEVTLTEEGTS